MKFGIFNPSLLAGGGNLHQRRIFHETVEQIQYAEEFGFDAVWLAEHHFTALASSLRLCRSLPTWRPAPKTIRIGTGVSVLTFHNPIFMARKPPCWTC